jgi:hypothetical protein
MFGVAGVERRRAGSREEPSVWSLALRASWRYLMLLVRHHPVRVEDLGLDYECRPIARMPGGGRGAAIADQIGGAGPSEVHIAHPTVVLRTTGPGNADICINGEGWCTGHTEHNDSDGEASTGLVDHTPHIIMDRTPPLPTSEDHTLHGIRYRARRDTTEL